MLILAGGWASPSLADEPVSTAPEGWSVLAYGGARASVRSAEGAVWLDYDLPKGEGYVLLRKAHTARLPERYALKFKLRTEAPAAAIELRLTDPGARNVWWWRRADYRGANAWQTLAIPSRAIEFAWGPSTEPLTTMDGVEWVITPGQAGRGSMAVKDFAIEPRPRPVDPDRPPAIQATSARAGHAPALAIDASPQTFWRSAEREGAAALTLDFGGERELGGLTLDWCPEGHARDYEVSLSGDGKAWRTAKRLSGRQGGRDTLYLPDTETRYLRLALHDPAQGSGFCLRNLLVLPIAAAASPNAFFTRLAHEAAPGTYPPYLLGKQTYFTVVGAPDSREEALLSESGSLEVARGGHTLEPFLFHDGKLVTWHDVRREQTLERGDLPIPSVTWQDRAVSLQVTAFATGGKEQALFARYRVANSGRQPAQLKLLLALRPFQVNPPWQSLNMMGGFAPIHAVDRQAGYIRVNDAPGLIPLTAPNEFGAMTFDQGELVDQLRRGRVPMSQSARDADGLAAAALAWAISLPAGGAQDIYVAIPQGDPAELIHDLGPAGAVSGAERLRQVTEDWAHRLAGPEFLGPPAARRLIEAARTNLGYILIHRDPPALYPGSRTYARAWIRDGAVISSALLGMGRTEEVRNFIAWYAGYQRPDGSIPCCVDRRGPDDLTEHDSHGEFIYTIAEYYRYTHDRDFLRQYWPAVTRTVAAIDALRQQRMTPAYQSGPQSIFYGLMPESVSHEGYAGNPVHAFWDGFWTLRGLKDAVDLAAALGDQAAVQRFTTLRDAFRQTLYAALERTIQEKKIAFLPGSVELADFDANATAVSINIGGEEGQLPAGPLARTFDEYGEYVRKREAGQLAWEAYTPYEVRSVEALVRLGRRDQALKLLDFLMTGQRPAAWHHWAEVVWRDPAAPKFIGDMPHGWIGAEFIRAVRSLFVLERERDQALVLAAGIPEAWLNAGEEVGVKRLPTPHGELSYRLWRTSPDTLRLSLTGALQLPPGRMVVQSPLERPLREVTINGQTTANFSAHEAKIDAFPAEVILRY